MKIFISADMEGIAGVTAWEEVDPDHARYPAAQAEMTAEVAAACEAAFEAGAREIWVRDAHWHARNLIGENLPKGVKLIRGWSRHPYLMVQEIDKSFDAALFVGYHSRAGSAGNPLAHTIEPAVHSIRINGELISEFRLYAGAAALENVPVVFLSGDREICESARALCPQIETATILEGHGASTVSVHPEDARHMIREGVKRALAARDFSRFPRLALSGPFEVEVRYTLPADACKHSHFPGARLKDEHTIAFKCAEYLDVLKTLPYVCGA